MMTLNLAGTWNLTRIQNDDSIPAQVPGDTHSAPLDARRLRTYPLAALTPSPEGSFRLLTLETGGMTFRNEHFFVPHKRCDLPAGKVALPRLLH